MNSLSYIPKFIYQNCISLQNAIGDDIPKKSSDWFVIVISTEPIRFELYLKDDFIKSQNSDYPMLEWANRNKMLFKLWQTNKWIDQKSGQYILCSFHNTFLLNKPTKKAIGSLAGACRTHGDDYDVYSLTPIKTFSVCRKRITPTNIVLTDTLQNKINQYKLPTINSVVQPDEIFAPRQENNDREIFSIIPLYIITADDEIIYLF